MRWIVTIAVNGIKKALVGTKRKERGVGQFADVLDVRPNPSGGIRAVDMNTVAARLAFRSGE